MAIDIRPRSDSPELRLSTYRRPVRAPEAAAPGSAVERPRPFQRGEPPRPRPKTPADVPTANSLGINFSYGLNDLKYAVIDEAQFRTLNELAASQQLADAAATKQRGQETIVGTNAMLSNAMQANVEIARPQAKVRWSLHNQEYTNHNFSIDRIVTVESNVSFIILGVQ